MKTVLSFIKKRMRRRPQVYIMPTRDGLWWIGANILLFMMGWGYSNNLCLSLALILLSLSMIILIEAHFNLDGIRIRSLSIEDQFAGLPARWICDLSVKRIRQRRGIKLTWDGPGPVGDLQIDETQEKSSAHGTWQFDQSQVWQHSTVVTKSTYPMGLFRTWSYHQVPIEAWVYPKLRVGPIITSQGQSVNHGSPKEVVSSSGEEPSQHRKYLAGDSVSRIAWKSLAKGQELQTKTFLENQSSLFYYEWPYGNGDESSKEILVTIIERHFKATESWGLKIASRFLRPDNSATHRKMSLRLLTESK